MKKVNMILLEAAELPNINLDSVTKEMVMSTCLPILMEAVCVLNMILLMEANLSMTKEEEMGHVKVFTYPGGRDGVTQHDPDHLGLPSACGRQEAPRKCCGGQLPPPGGHGPLLS